jgi:hypothetical protein
MLIMGILMSVVVGGLAGAFLSPSDLSGRFLSYRIPFNGSQMQLKAVARNNVALKAISIQHQSHQLELLEITQQDMVDMLDLAKADAILHLPDNRWVKQCESFIPKEQVKPRLDKIEQFCDFLLGKVVPLNEQIQNIKQNPGTQKNKKEQYNQKLQEYEKLFRLPTLAEKKQLKSIPSKFTKKGMFSWNG